MIPVALYLRMSDGKQETSLADQRKACLRYAKEHGLRIIVEYIDEGISGDATEKRAAFQRMIADAALGKFAGILCWDQDRFGRFDGIEAGFWIKPLRDRSIFLETVGQGRIDWNDFAGRIVYSIQQESKHAYLRDLSRNVNRGMLSAALQGKPLGNLPRGYVSRDGRIEVVESDAEIIREIYRLYLSGLSCREVARELNNRGVPTVKAAQWTRTTVYQALTNEWYTGLYVWNATGEGKYSEVRNGSVAPIQNGNGLRQKEPEDCVRIEQHHEPIIDRKTFDRVQSALAGNRRLTSPRKNGSVFVLSGLLVCGSCGAAMHGRHRGRSGLPYYVCSRSLHSAGCRSNSVLESELLDLILREAARQLSDSTLIRKVTESLERQLQTTARASKATENRLAAVRTKLGRAKVRLVECDRDLLPVVQSSVRALMVEEAELVAELKRSTDAASEAKAIGPTVERIIEKAKQLADRAGGSTELRRELRQWVNRVTVHCVTDPAHRSRFVLQSAEISLKIGAHLHAAASRREQD